MSDPGKNAILRRARRLRAEVQQIFADCASYNDAHPEQAPIDPDEDGQLLDLLLRLDSMIEGEPRRPQ